ncbi:aromatic compound dioxygenase [Punctularia strigosozonata HHB-11173 SS5]|uniref:aromatic compound dioxygenase n=1 Tax=Punctularia strigosozonata (strain HHB-11173) TaxID=741275 RepID=UPI000441687C|nr:aromatic compound dioxygenase [Punctularia strigosozonata HHB-11173 SS5]EIN08550.1 aromatic compound dioxygenase [Punctularia strigosozonata HHB-11173 SS5]
MADSCLQYSPEGSEAIINSLLKLIQLTPDAYADPPSHPYNASNEIIDPARAQPIPACIHCLVIKHLHAFVEDTSLTTAEWMAAIQFLSSLSKMDIFIFEFVLLSDVLSVSALVDAINNPPQGNATESSVLEPFFTEDAPDVNLGGSIVSEGKRQCIYVEGRVVNTKGEPISEAVIETWETDKLVPSHRALRYAVRGTVQPDCQRRLRLDKEGKYGYREAMPVAYPIPGDGPVGDLLMHLGRHNMRPNHLYLMISAPGCINNPTAIYPEGDGYLNSDALFGVKKSLVVVRIPVLQRLEDVNDDAEARASIRSARGFDATARGRRSPRPRFQPEVRLTTG